VSRIDGEKIPHSLAPIKPTRLTLRIPAMAAYAKKVLPSRFAGRGKTVS
jgi:hypothetical protein